MAKWNRSKWVGVPEEQLVELRIALKSALLVGDTGSPPPIQYRIATRRYGFSAGLMTNAEPALMFSGRRMDWLRASRKAGASRGTSGRRIPAGSRGPRSFAGRPYCTLRGDRSEQGRSRTEQEDGPTQDDGKRNVPGAAGRNGTSRGTRSMTGLSVFYVSEAAKERGWATEPDQDGAAHDFQ